MEDDADHNKSINTNKCDENHNPNNSKIQIACRLNEFGWQRCQKDDLIMMQ